MGDITEPPSSAAQSAQAAEEDTENRGFITRIFEALSPATTPETPVTVTPVAQAPMPGILNLRRMRVEDVAIPKADIVATPVTTSKEDLVELFRETGMTRIPVFEGTLDTPLGFVHMKDFALQYSFRADAGALDLNALLRPLLFVPPSMPLGVLLQKMQAERSHMALVIDEYGGTDALVTIEDLIEQVVGAIEDEHDVDEAKNWTEESPGVYMAMAKTPLEAFEAEIGMALTDHHEIDEEEVDTLGGLVFMLSGAVPARGQIVIHPDGPEFEVVDADPRRIKRLRVRMPHAKDS